MIPSAARRDPFVFTSTLNGRSADGELVPDPGLQLQRAFEKLPAALAGAGATLDEVVQVGVYLSDAAAQPLVDAAWRARFGDAGSAPARRVTPMFLPYGELVQIQATAVAGARRRSIAAAAGGLVPDAAVAGVLFVTSAIDGRGPGGERPAGVRDEIEQAFANVDALLARAGGTLADVLHYWAFAADGVDAPDFTPSWLRRFPHEGDRPARKTFLRAPLHGAGRVCLQATALLGGGRRSNYEVPGVRHRDPLPLGARVGRLFMSSGILANAPDPHAPDGLGPLGKTLEEQVSQAFATLERLTTDQGGSLRNVVHLGALVNRPDDAGAVAGELAKRFSPGDAPAFQPWSLPMASAQQRVQLFATAVF